MAKSNTTKTPAPAKVVEVVTVEGARALKFPVERIDPKTGKTQIRCGSCGKWLFKDAAQRRGEGDLCNCLRSTMGYSDASLAEHKAQFTKPEVPEGWIKIAVLHTLCNKHRIPVSKMLACIGWDRGLYPPVEPRFQPYYIGNARYVDGWCGSAEGLKAIEACTRKKPKPQVTEPIEPVIKVKTAKGKAVAKKGTKKPAEEPQTPAESVAEAVAEALAQ